MTIPARFNDGLRAVTHDVTVQVSPDRLEIVDSNHMTIARWSLENLEVIDAPDDRQQLRLSAKGDRNARLTVSGEKDVDYIRTLLPELEKQQRYHAPSAPQMTAYIVALLLVAGALFWSFSAIVEVAATTVPNHWRNSVGESTVEQLAALFTPEGRKKFCQGGRGSRALQTLVTRLETGLKNPPKISIRVINSKVVNAFAAPGGQLVLFRGLIDNAESADEVAGVIAHEMGHILENHPTEFAVRQLGLKVLTSFLFGQEGAIPGIGQQLVSLSYTRDDERDADRIAVERLTAANIRTSGFAEFFRRLAKEETAMPEFFKYMSSHPANEDRAAEAGAAIGGKGSAMSEDDWRAVKLLSTQC